MSDETERSFFWEQDCTCGAPEDKIRQRITQGDFHRLISHILYGGHLCTPDCAADALADSSKGIPR